MQPHFDWENRFMKNKIKYTNESMDGARIISDFLPSPKDLVLKEERVKVTISLSRASLDFFKKQAKQHNAPYQKMIRNLLDIYALQQS